MASTINSDEKKASNAFESLYTYYDSYFISLIYVSTTSLTLLKIIINRTHRSKCILTAIL
jgi:hypothetical protein